MFIRAGLMKSSATSPMMSAMLNPSPAMNGLLVNLGGRVGVPIGLGDGVEKLQLKPPVPHFDARAVERADAKQWLRRMKLLETTTNCGRFGNHFAVAQLERRHGPERIENVEGRRLVLQAGQIHVDGRHGHSLFR